MEFEIPTDGLIPLLEAVIILIFVALAALLVISYVFMGIGLYAMAKKRGIPQKAFWAWIPIGNDYLFGLLARDTSVSFGTRTYLNMHVILPLSATVNLVFAILSVFTQSQSIAYGPLPLFVDLFSYALSLALTILSTVCFYGLIKGYSTANCALHTVLAVFIPIYMSILIFVYRNRQFVGNPTISAIVTGDPMPVTALPDNTGNSDNRRDR